MIEPYYQNNLVTLYKGDCLEVMPQLDIAFDCCITDPPYGYGKTSCKWDQIIPFDKMWSIVLNCLKHNGAICLFGNEPFTSKLICSKIDLFRYRWNWKKERGSAFQLAKVQPLPIIEDICVFSKGKCANGANNPMCYFPIMQKSDKPCFSGGAPIRSDLYHKTNMIALHKHYKYKYPINLLEFKKPYGKERVHPTQKPVALIEYLIKTYTNENEIVLDFAAGSGTTGVACINTNRRCVLIEKEEKYCLLTKQRLIESSRQKKLFY